MTTQRTPSPWLYDAETGSISSESREGKAEIASLYTGYLEPFEAEQQANLRLILAAPDYHEGALAFIAYEDAMSSGDDISAMIHYANASKLLRAANAKATGVAA